MSDHPAAHGAVPPFPFQPQPSPAAALPASSLSTRAAASASVTAPPSVAPPSLAQPAGFYPPPLFSPPTLPASDPGGGGLAPSAPGHATSFPPAGGSILSSSAILATNLAAMASLSLAALSPAELLFRARLSLQCERFEELTHYTRALVFARGGGPLSMEERGLFALGFKRLLAAKRAGWRYAYSIELKEKNGRKKIEMEIARETERETKEKANSAATAAAAAASSSSSSSSTTAAAAPVAASIVPVAAPASSSLPLLHARLSQSLSQLQILHGFRYQLFWESSVLIAELMDLISGKLIPKLLPNHNENVMGFAAQGGMMMNGMPAPVAVTSTSSASTATGTTASAASTAVPSVSSSATGRGILGIVELCVKQELKRTSGGGGGGASSSSSSSTAASSSSATAPTPSGGASASSSSKGDKTNESSASAGGTSDASSTGASASSSATGAAPVQLQLLTPLRNWSLESEIDTQMRLLDNQTHFLRALRSTPLVASGSFSSLAASAATPASAAESFVFYLKFLADSRRILAEFLAEHEYESMERNVQSMAAQCLYVVAKYVAFQLLSASHPTRLGLSLNQSVFYYEVLAKPDRAAQLAKNAFDSALAEQRNAALAAAAAEKNAAVAAASSAAAAAGVPATAGGSTAASNTAAVAGSSLDGASSTNAASSAAVVSAASSADKSAAASSVGAPGSGGSAAGFALITGASSGASMKDSLMIMQLLKNNLTMWTESS